MAIRTRVTLYSDAVCKDCGGNMVAGMRAWKISDQGQVSYKHNGTCPQFKVKMTTDVRQSIERIVEYMYDDEKNHYAEMDGTCSAEELSGHIFLDIKRVKAFLESINE